MRGGILGSMLDLGSIVETLIGTVAGAFFAAGTTAFMFMREGHRNYNARLDDALASVMLAVPARVRELDEFAASLDQWSRHEVGDRPESPGPYEISVNLEAARLVARGDDARTLESIGDVLAEMTLLAPRPQRARLSQLAEAIRRWRHGELGREPWSYFARLASEISQRKGLTPPPLWDIGRRIVTDAGSKYEAQLARRPWWQKLIDRRRERRQTHQQSRK